MSYGLSKNAIEKAVPFNINLNMMKDLNINTKKFNKIHVGLLGS